jgi:6-phosphogluconolactonase (cycloisomerase 2 family)
MGVSNMVKAWLCKSICANLAAVALELLAGCGGGSNISSSSSRFGTGDAFVYLPVCHETQVGQCSNNGAIFGFSNDSSGALTPITGSPFSSPGEPGGVAVTPNGKFLYVSLFLNNVVSGYSINPASGVVATVVPLLSAGINAYSISTSGTLTRQSASDFNNGNFCSSLAADPVADLLFAVEGRSGTGDVDVLTIDSTTGALIHVATSPTGGNLASDIAIDSLGTVVFISNEFGGVGAYSVASGQIDRTETERDGCSRQKRHAECPAELRLCAV